MDQISLFWPVLVQNSRLAFLLGTVAMGIAMYAAKRRVQRLALIPVHLPVAGPLRGTLKG